MAFCITEHFSLFHSSSLVYLHHPHATPHYPILCLSAGFHSRVCMAHPWPAGSNGLQMDLLCWWNVDLFCLGDNVDVFFFPCAIWSIIFRWWCWYYIDKEQVFCCLSKEPLCNQATEKKCAIHHYWDNSFQHHQRDQITGAEMQNVGSFKQTARMCPSVSVWSDLKGFSSQCQGECAVSAFAVQKWAASIVHGSRRGGGEWEPSADMKQDSCGCL